MELTKVDFKFNKSNAKNQAKSAITVNPGISSGVSHPTVKGENILEDDVENLEGIADNPTPSRQNRPNIIALVLLAIVLYAMGIVATSSCGGSLSFKIPFELQLNKNNCSVQIDQGQK
jgi:hypothetical protein